jgi:AAA ATPase domain
MKLIQVEIFDYKSIKHEKIDFPTNQTCLVGKNESGKSSIIQAISHLNFIQYDFQRNLVNKSSTRYPEGFPVVSGVFEFDESNWHDFYEMLLVHVSPTSLKSIKKSFNRQKIQIKRWGNGLSNISLLVQAGVDDNVCVRLLDIVKSKSEFIDTFWHHFYPSIEYFENEDLLLEPATVDDLLGSDRKFETFRRLLHLGECGNIKLLQTSDSTFISTYLSKIQLNTPDTFSRGKEGLDKKPPLLLRCKYTKTAH